MLCVQQLAYQLEHCAPAFGLWDAVNVKMLGAVFAAQEQRAIAVRCKSRFAHALYACHGDLVRGFDDAPPYFG